MMIFATGKEHLIARRRTGREVMERKGAHRPPFQHLAGEALEGCSCTRDGSVGGNEKLSLLRLTEKEPWRGSQATSALAELLTLIGEMGPIRVMLAHS